MSKPATTTTSLLKQAFRQLRAGDYAGADTAFGAVLEQSPEHPAALHGRGIAALQSGQPGPALGWLEKARAIDADNPELLVNLAVALNALGRHDSALIYLDHALSTDACNRQALSGRARTLKQLERLDEALETARY
jgi:Flp pilus assembly protein TadD